jgi:hypothetical protein
MSVTEYLARSRVGLRHHLNASAAVADFKNTFTQRAYVVDRFWMIIAKCPLSYLQALLSQLQAKVTDTNRC